MTVTAPRRPAVAARRVGYLIAVLVNVALLIVVNVIPGWRELPFLTPDTAEVIGLVNMSLAVGVAVNLVYPTYDPPWLTSLGGLVTTGVGLAVLARLWQVFPFDFGDPPFRWATVVRVGLGVCVGLSIVALLVQAVSLARALLAASCGHAGGRGETRDNG